MITRILSRYNFKYLRGLVYMLQASEYSINDFFVWYAKVKDFREVEQRKKLVKTFKAKMLLGLLSLATAFGLAVVLVRGNWLLLAIYILLWPYLMVLVATFFTFLINKLQRPIERRIINKAKSKLKNHKALKIGIAGSYGKTTMKEILKTVLAQSKKVAATPDNKNT